MKGLDLAPDFRPPVDLMTQKIAVLARTGAGKTNTATVVAEEVMDAKQQVVALDPKGDWWGLRSSADGKAAGYPITVLGGDHGDLPLEPTAGGVIADVAAEGASLVIDLSAFSNADMRRFVTDFAERFYRAKAQHVSPVLLILEEADEVVPQRFSGELARMVGAIERLVKRGRFRGIGTLLVTQRSASLNKDVLTQTEVLIVQQTTSPQDRKAIDDWVENHPDQEKRNELMTHVASLKKGEAFIWSPTFLETFKRVRFRMRRTYDAGRDVKIGEMRKAPKVLAPVDLEKLGAQMRATVEKAKQNDPAALRAEVGLLKRQLAQSMAMTPKVVDAVPKTVEKLIIKDSQVTRLEKAIDRLNAISGNYNGASAAITGIAGQLVSALSGAAAVRGGSGAAAPVRAATPAASPSTRHDDTRSRTAGRHLVGDVRSGEPHAPKAPGLVKKYLQKVLDAMATLEALGYPRPTNLQVATWSKMSVRGGAYGGYVRELVAAGMVDKDGGDPSSTLSLTSMGRTAANANTAMTTSDLHALARSVARPYLHKVLDPLLAAWPQDMGLDALAAEANMSTAGGAFGGYLRELRAFGFVTVTKTTARAADVLFLEAA